MKAAVVDPEREKELVRKLVERLHISVSERQELPGRIARMELIVTVVEEIVRESGRFPADADLDGPFDGGVIRQYLRAGLVDAMHFAISPLILGSREPLFHDLDLRALGSWSTSRENVTRVVVARRG